MLLFKEKNQYAEATDYWRRSLGSPRTYQPPIFMELAGEATTNGIVFDYHFALLKH